MANKLIVSAAPHITSADSTSKIMGRVCIALLPTLIASVLIFGFQALLLTAVTVAACVVFEYAYCKLVGRDVTISDLSAVVTGLLLAFNLPAGLPVWMSLVGAFIAIVIIKQLFGGLGYNFANPAIVGRIAMALGFTGAMTSYTYPENGIDALASATPLAVEVSILVSSLVFSFVNWRNMWVRMGLHLLLLIPIVGVTYEFNRYVGGHDNRVTRFLSRPGLWLQNFTTNEPDDSMLEVAIRALELVIPEEKGKDAW